jgi:hypothetical protein
MIGDAFESVAARRRRGYTRRLYQRGIVPAVTVSYALAADMRERDEWPAGVAPVAYRSGTRGRVAVAGVLERLAEDDSDSWLAVTDRPCGQWPHAIHSASDGSSARMVVSLPCPVCTTVPGGTVSQRPR